MERGLTCMEAGLLVCAAVLAVIVVILLAKISYMRKAAREIEEGFRERLQEETNTLITVSSGDSRMKTLTAAVNEQLRLLRTERHRFYQGDRELKEAVVNISHDLRTPLTAIFGYLDLLEREELSENVRRYPGIIRERAQTMKQLTDELFYYSVAASRNTEIECTELALNGVLEESLSAYYEVFKRCGIEPEIHMPEKNVRCSLNRNSLLRVFDNILSNALKYSGGDLEVTLEESGEILFSNSAPGLDEVEAGRLFERFYTVETAKRSTGLGLSIAKILIDQMHGTIGAEYEEGMLTIKVCFAGE